MVQAEASLIDWQHPILIWGIAVVAVSMLAGAWVLARRQRGKVNRGAVICGAISILLHVVLIVLLPYASRRGGGPAPSDAESEPGTVAVVNLSAFSDAELSDSAAEFPEEENSVALPSLASEATNMEEWLQEWKPEAAPEANESSRSPELPDAPDFNVTSNEDTGAIDEIVDQWLSDELSEASETVAQDADPGPAIAQSTTSEASQSDVSSSSPDASAVPSVAAVPGQSNASEGRVLGDVAGEFANRAGAAKTRALVANGGDAETEAAVAAALRWLATYQHQDGYWSAAASGAGKERRVLGHDRQGAGSKATTAISGLALLSMLGSGNTHQVGPYQQEVRKGLQYLVFAQHPNGSMAGDSTLYAKTYSHGMATLAMCEAAAMSRDDVAVESARRAVSFTLGSQHPTTGGWRYLPGDPGDMSQLGWQAMVLISASAAGIEIPSESKERVKKFLRSVRAGRTGGLASYRPAGAPSRTMTAEALAIRLMLGEEVPQNELQEAEQYLLEELPGAGDDNFYYWYYASLALHQLQSDSWRVWNDRMKGRLLELQEADGSWPASTTWGGYGGKVYCTSMACLCLEVYYRHLTDDQRGRSVAELHSDLIPSTRDR